MNGLDFTELFFVVLAAVGWFLFYVTNDNYKALSRRQQFLDKMYDRLEGHYFSAIETCNHHLDLCAEQCGPYDDRLTPEGQRDTIPLRD